MKISSSNSFFLALIRFLCSVTVFLLYFFFIQGGPKNLWQILIDFFRKLLIFTDFWFFLLILIAYFATTAEFQGLTLFLTTCSRWMIQQNKVSNRFKFHLDLSVLSHFHFSFIPVLFQRSKRLTNFDATNWAMTTTSIGSFFHSPIMRGRPDRGLSATLSVALHHLIVLEIYSWEIPSLLRHRNTVFFHSDYFFLNCFKFFVKLTIF